MSGYKWNEAQFLKLPDVHFRIWPIVTFKRIGICFVIQDNKALERYRKRQR